MNVTIYYEKELLKQSFISNHAKVGYRFRISNLNNVRNFYVSKS